MFPSCTSVELFFDTLVTIEIIVLICIVIHTIMGCIFGMKKQAVCELIERIPLYQDNDIRVDLGAMTYEGKMYVGFIKMATKAGRDGIIKPTDIVQWIRPTIWKKAVLNSGLITAAIKNYEVRHQATTSDSGISSSTESN